ncbi:PucR family transcriptional regulator [Spirillospora albida]|uniref:PucR family transcriptional regulator n=1 Tax=Spirillospora albida TaxID=58123 RepID=UPI000564676A|nr:helix-turn-helix domain-containing protein [Spirillospora albida]
MPSTASVPVSADREAARLAKAASGRLRERLPELADRLVADVLAEDPVFTEFVSRDDFWESVRDSLDAGIESMARRVRGQRPDLSVAERIGRRRAEQGLPLESLLRCYRIGGRIVWEALIEVVAEDDPDALPVLLRYASTVWHTIERQSTVVSEVYRRTESELLKRSGERVQALLDALLEGRGADGGLAQAAAAALDLPEHGRYAVAVVRTPRQAPGFAERPEELSGLRFVWRTRTDAEVAVISLGAAGTDEVLAALGPLVKGEAGLSTVVDGLAGLGRARWLAEIALATCRPGERGLVRLDERLPTALVAAQPELGGLLSAGVLGPLAALDAADREVLLETLRTWLECDGSAMRTAGRLYCHRNTVFNRLRRLEQLTSRSLQRPRDVVELTLALEANRLLKDNA